ncbi:helix-turn-helix domain-containing protein [Haloarcula amylovorans]|uniref:helix-turn-helix domain-containing protein n=1 Tax=Haloarcula amylovorans TaxID=2562280 RepID=UPI0010767C14
MTDDADAAEVLALLDDTYAQSILRETRNEAMSAKELSETCDISISTVYRRAERLVDCGLLAERRIAQPDGNHHSMYEARLDELTVRLTDSGLDVTISKKPTGDLADRFTDMWEGL